MLTSVAIRSTFAKLIKDMKVALVANLRHNTSLDTQVVAKRGLRMQLHEQREEQDMKKYCTFSNK